jgi:hypothetical protein
MRAKLNKMSPGITVVTFFASVYESTSVVGNHVSFHNKPIGRVI